MRTKIIFLTFLFLGIKLCKAQFLSNPANTYAVIIGVLEWKDGLSPFEKKNRKDQEFEQILITKGVPKNQIFSLYDSKATISNIISAIENVSKSAKNDIIIYYAGHGLNEKDGIYFANYDINLNNIKNTGFNIDMLSQKLSTSLANNIWLMADCCYSGGILKTGRKISNFGKNVVALSSATASNISTGNWTFTQTLLDCINGNPLSDFNLNGIIDLSELKKEIRLAMKCRERQLNGAEFFGIDESTVFSKTNGNVKNSTSNWTIGEYAWGKYENKWKPIRIKDVSGDKIECEFYFYSEKVIKILNSTDLKPMHFVNFQENSLVEVLWNGQWYKATVKKVNGDFCLITYTNYGSSYDEWVLYDRIRTGKERTISVREGSKYYPAKVLIEKNGKYFIHYDGWDNSWDEWIGADRIKQ
jgi:hypothetical protein